MIDGFFTVVKEAVEVMRESVTVVTERIRDQRWSLS